MRTSTPRVVLCCDVGPDSDHHHLLRCLALAEELVFRGTEVVFVCDAAADSLAQAQIAARGLTAVPPVSTGDAHLELCDRLAVDAVVFDSHTLPGEVYVAARESGRPTLAVVQGALRGAVADTFVDQSPGADEDRPRVPRGSTLLAGPDYALMRNDILANRPISPPAHTGVEIPKVLGAFAAPDATVMAGPAMARVLVATGRPFDATFVTSAAGAREQIEAVRPSPRQRIAVSTPDRWLAERAARSDVVLSTAGLSASELLCLGAAVGLAWAAEDDVGTYRRLMVQRAVIGLGSVESLGSDPESGVEKATRLLSDARERTRLAETAWRLVDGQGRARVVDVLLQQL